MLVWLWIVIKLFKGKNLIANTLDMILIKN